MNPDDMPDGVFQSGNVTLDENAGELRVHESDTVTTVYRGGEEIDAQISRAGHILRVKEMATPDKDA